MDKIEVLDKQISDLKLKKAESLKTIPSRPRREDIDFSPLLEMCERNVDEMTETGRSGKDFEAYVFETAMECIFGPDFFKWKQEYMKARCEAGLDCEEF